MSQEQHRKDQPQTDGTAQQPGLTGAESSGSSGTQGRQPGEPNSSSGAMDGQGTFGSGSNGPGMDQSGAENKGKQALKERTEKVEMLKKGLRDDDPFESTGDPESAQDGLI